MSCHMFYHIFPAIGTYLYLTFPTTIDINPSTLKYICIVHNTFLIIFSFWTFISLVQIMYTHGFVFQHNYYFNIPQFKTIQFYFYLSKYYEYMDTFILYAKKKKPIFLQKYHHIGAVIGWHLLYYYQIDGIFGPTLFNSLVHTVMYSYYLASILKIKFLLRLKKYITKLQIFQLANIHLVLYLWRPPIETRFNYSIIVFFYLYVVGLILGFLHYYNKTYKPKELEGVNPKILN